MEPIPPLDYTLAVDEFGLPLDAFGAGIWPEFYAVLGRIVAVNGKIEYIKDRLEHLPSSETDGVTKARQFARRYRLGRDDRNAVVHSFWSFTPVAGSPDLVLGIRYKVRKKASGELATVSIRDVPDSERDQELVEYDLDGLERLLRRDIVTMRIGMQAMTDIGIAWAINQKVIEP